MGAVCLKFKFCKTCSAITERNKYGQCKPCNRAACARYADKNREKKMAADAAYRHANREKRRAKDAAYRLQNPDKVRESKARHYVKNVEKIRQYRAANRELHRVMVHNYRARKKENGGRLSPRLGDSLFRLQRGKCACGCGQSLGDGYHLDHIMPLALGGTNTDDNIQLLRPACNKQKNAKHPVEFMQQRGFLL